MLWGKNCAARRAADEDHICLGVPRAGTWSVLKGWACSRHNTPLRSPDCPTYCPPFAAATQLSVFFLAAAKRRKLSVGLSSGLSEGLICSPLYIHAFRTLQWKHTALDRRRTPKVSGKLWRFCGKRAPKNAREWRPFWRNDAG